MKLFKKLKETFSKNKEDVIEEDSDKNKPGYICDCPECGKGIFQLDVQMKQAVKFPKRGKDARLYHKKCSRKVRRQGMEYLKTGTCKLERELRELQKQE